MSDIIYRVIMSLLFGTTATALIICGTLVVVLSIPKVLSSIQYTLQEFLYNMYNSSIDWKQIGIDSLVVLNIIICVILLSAYYYIQL